MEIFMGYKFTYQKILDIRNIQEELKSVETASKQRELQEEQEELEKLNELKSDHVNGNGKKTGKSPHELLLNDTYMNQMNRKLDDQKQEVEKRESELKDKKTELLEATKSKKIMDKLKETDYQNFKTEEDRKVQKDLDDIGAKMTKNKKENQG